MSRADYAHHNEEADRIWWEEEGRHYEQQEPDDDSYWADEMRDDYEREDSDLPEEEEADHSCS